MTWLKKFGQIVLKVTEVVSGFAPLIQTTVPNSANVVREVQSDLAAVAAVIANVEAVGQVANMPGADKLKAATPLVAQVLLQSSVLAQHKIANPALFQSGAQKIADGMADVLNALKDDVASESKT